MATIIGNNGNNVLFGTNWADTISGRGGNDVIFGRAGSDVINGDSGDDRISGGSGNDQILGGDGNDRIDGGSGNDIIDGGRGSDRIDGGRGNDQILGGDGNDIVDGGSGNDSIDGGSGNDVIDGGSGNDRILGGAGNDIVDGGSGNDFVDGGSGNDQLFGGAGDDALIGGAGADQLTGGSGSDRFVFLDASDSPAASGWDRITDFTQGRDKIDLSALLGSANLAWGGKTAIANGAWYQNSGSRTFVFADTTGDGRADLKIELTNTRGLTLNASDFIGVGSASAANSAPVVASTDVTGAVTELVTPVGNLTDSGTIAFTDADLADTHSVSAVTPSSGALGTLTASVSTDTTGSGVGGVVTWNYSVAAADVEFLAAGQHKLETFTFNVLDGHGGSVSRTVSVDITGTNEAPVISSHGGGASASVSMAENTTMVNTVTATDPDAADTKTFSIVSVADGGGADAAKFSIDPATGMLRFVSAPNFEAPTDANGDNVYDVTVKVTDSNGLFDTQAIAVTVTDANDAPVSGGDAAAAGTEDAALIAGAVPAASDVDGDALTYALVDAAPAGVTFNADGTFTVAPLAADQGLDDGESRVVSFQYVARDGTVSSAPATVTVTINGVNDAPVGNSAPVVAGTDVTGAVTELVTPVGNLTDSGTIAFTDVDLADIHSVSAVAPSSGALGTLTASVSTDTTGSGVGGVVSWNYSVAASDAEFLAQDQHQIETFTFDVLDGQGGSVLRTVSVDITGTNDAPVVAGTDVTGTVTEDDQDPSLFAGGTLTFADVDLIDGHTTSVAADSGNTVGGTLSAPVTDNGDGTGTIDWTYEVANADVQFLAEGETTGESFAIQVADGHGGFDTKLITLTITGVNDAPVITSNSGDDAVNVFVAENTHAVTDVNATDVDNDSVLTYSIVDGADMEQFSVDPATGVLTFNVAPQFEFPADADGDNVYDVVVQVSDEHDATDTQSIAVTVMANQPPVAVADNVITNVFRLPFNIPEWALLANDSDPEGNPIDVRVDNLIKNSASGGTATHFPGTGTDGYVQFVETRFLEGGSFKYQALDNGGAASSPEATVNVNLDSDGNPDLNGTSGNDILVLGLNSGAMRLVGMDGNDILIGGDGNDTLSGGVGDDTIDGGAGVDLLDFSEVSTNFAFTLGAGGSGSAMVNGADTYSNIEGVIGGSGDNSLTGNAGDNILRGGDGNDALNGGDGVDLLDFSEVSTNFSFTLGSDGSGSATVNGTDTYSNMEGVIGGSGDDSLTGNASDNILQGGDGNDVLTGGSGSDIFDYNALLDAGTAGDTITDFNKEEGDKLDLHDLLQTFADYNGSNAFTGDYLRFTQEGSNTIVQVDSDGGADALITLVTLNDVLLNSTDTSNFIL